jgi:hypothetical protein
MKGCQNDPTRVDLHSQLISAGPISPFTHNFVKNEPSVCHTMTTMAVMPVVPTGGLSFAATISL